MSTHDNGLGNCGDLLVLALASGLSYSEAAEVAGCSKSTVARRMAEPEFRVEVAAEREEYVMMLRGRLLQAAPVAVEVLAELMTTAARDADRIRAARRVLEIQRRGPTGVDPIEVEHVVRRLVDVALAHLPEGSERAFLDEVRLLA